jgi:DNA topoisomerase-1
VIELIARTAIRPGNESYARLNGTRGATTLLKSNVTLEDDNLVLTFTAKGGKAATSRARRCALRCSRTFSQSA